MHKRKDNKVMRKKRTNRKFRFNVAIDDFDMDNIILDLGFDVNILPKKTWEEMGKSKLLWSPVQLILEKECKIYPIGKLENIEVNIDGEKSKAYFEVIEIMMTQTHIQHCWVLIGIFIICPY